MLLDIGLKSYFRRTNFVLIETAKITFSKRKFQIFGSESYAKKIIMSRRLNDCRLFL